MSIVLSRIKKKITNISTIRRIINTMKIISTTKFQYCKNLKDNVSPYVDSLKEIIEKLNFMIDYKKKSQNKQKKVFIIISSNLGFCANYNDDIFNFALSKIKKEDKIIPIGSKGLFFLKKLDFDIDDNYVDLNKKIKFDDIESFAKKIFKKYFLGKYSEINIIFMRRKNEIKNMKILPIENKKEMLFPIIEIDDQEFLNEIIPMYFARIIYQSIIEAQISEQVFRKITTENAIQNTDKILNELKNEFNKMNQKSITQEIIEVITSKMYD